MAQEAIGLQGLRALTCNGLSWYGMVLDTRLDLASDCAAWQLQRGADASRDGDVGQQVSVEDTAEQTNCEETSESFL